MLKRNEALKHEAAKLIKLNAFRISAHYDALLRKRVFIHKRCSCVGYERTFETNL